MRRFIDQLTAPQVLALARFIVACRKLRGTRYWRTKFDECARRSDFAPYAKGADRQCLLELERQYGTIRLACLRTPQVLQAAQRIAKMRRPTPRPAHEASQSVHLTSASR